MSSPTSSPLRRRLEQTYPEQDQKSINTYRLLSRGNEAAIDECDEIYKPAIPHDRAAPRQPLRERPQNLTNLPRHGRPLGEILGSSNTAAGRNTRRSSRSAAKITKSTPAQPLNQAGAVTFPPTVPKATQYSSFYEFLNRDKEDDEDEEDETVLVPRKRMRDARKNSFDSDSEDIGQEKDVEGELPPRIRESKPFKRLRGQSRAVASELEGDTNAISLDLSEVRGNKSPDRRRSNRITSDIGHQDTDVEDDYNETLDPQYETLFEDDPYAEEQTDEEEYESDLKIEDQRIGQGHHTAKPKTTSRSKRSRTGKQPMKPKSPPDPDNFARLHLGSTSIPFCLQDISTQRRSLWASRLYACLKSYQNQCRNTYQQLGDYHEAIKVLSDRQTGSLTKTVASVFPKQDLDVLDSDVDTRTWSIGGTLHNPGPPI